LVKVLGVAVAGLTLVLVCNATAASSSPVGIPFCVPIVLFFLIFGSSCCSNPFREVHYAIGANAEAARRAGVRLGLNRMVVRTHWTDRCALAFSLRLDRRKLGGR